jgi:valyl-tRNA synthetase
VNKEMATKYNPDTGEDRLYAMWLERGYFHAEVDEGREPYTIMIPPPNITSQLHIGHAFEATLIDILIRFKRMQGFSTLWMPGTDHAAIATEVKIVEDMATEGLNKADLGREGFMERAWKWYDLYGSTIINQLQKLGSSCDWKRSRFTMDEGLSDAVLEVFVRLYDKGLIYKGERLVNWCPQCKTSISDAEVEHEDKSGGFWYFKYPIKDSDEFVTFATTRPETMLGDVGLAVNPNDERYAHLIGKTAIMPVLDRELPIVADDYVKQDFGTGIVKITPAHDFNDFELGDRHGLPRINIMNDDGTINENGMCYEGLDRYAARKRIISEFEEHGLLAKKEDIIHAIGCHDRCGTVVEPLLKLQWFVKMASLAAPALAAYKNDELKIVPPRFGKVYAHWLENIKDWCISRQLWWGHRIPAYYCACGNMMVSKIAPTSCVKCGSSELWQDEDSLDTWFSSALWPFSTLGWPQDTKDLKYFYPTNVLCCGYEILFFWVIRMVFSGLEFMGELPFKDVLLHGIVRDDQGRKMSKSLGNGIDPLDIIEEYGADSLRFSLITGNTPGNDLRLYNEKVESARNFTNKIWNAARFIAMQDGEIPTEMPVLTAADK